MDPSTPVAGRTRSKHAIYYNECHEKMKGKKEKGNEYADSESESEFSGCGGGGGGGGSGRGKRKKEVALGKQTRGKKNWGLWVDSGSLDISDDGCQEMGVEESDDDDVVVVECSEEGDDDDVEFLGFDGWGPSIRKKLKKSGGNFENAIPIEVDSSDQDEVEVISEEMGEGGYSFGNSSLKTGSCSCSKVGGLKGAKFGPVDVDEVVSSRHEMGGKYIVELNGGRSSERVQLELEDLEESVNVNDLQFDDSDELDSSSHDDSDELEESSNEDNDDDDDEDFTVGDQILEQPEASESDETSENEESSENEEIEDVDGGNSTKRASKDREVKAEKEVMDWIKRRKAYGPDVLVDSSKDKNDDEGNSINVTPQGVNCVARRTRSESGSKFKSVPSESKEGEEVDGNNATKRVSSIDGEWKEKEVIAGIKRKKTHGLDVLVDSNEDKYEDEGNSINITHGVNCVARRTRSPSGSKFKEQITKPGTVSRPLCINKEEGRKEQDSSGGDDGGGDGHDHDNQTKHSEKKINSKKGNVDSFQPEEGGKYEEGTGRSTKRKRVCAPKRLNFVKILLDSILNQSNVEELVSSRGGIHDQKTSSTHIATWKFLYPINDPDLLEDLDDEEENKLLWTELDFALRSSEIDNVDSFMIDNKDFTTSDVDSDPSSLCSRGNHQFIINEEVGLICKFCSCIGLEMRYFLPSFNKQAWRTLQNKNYGETDCYTFNELQFQNSGCNSQLGCDPHVHAKGTVWEIIPGIKNSLYQHQREGFEFIWNIIAGGIYLDELKSRNFNDGSGCVISHAPGTGKTRLILAFLQAYMELYPTCKPIIIAPRSMLLTWEEQCKIWSFSMPFHILNNKELSGKEDMAVLQLLKEAKLQDRSVDINRMVKIYSWVRGKSILGLSYRLFERLVWKEEVTKGEGKKRQNIRSRTDYETRKILLELPGLLVLDEGHTPRNDQSLIWKALTKIQTEKRIILSGTPFQNNFDELYNTLCVVRPKFAETILIKSSRCNDFQRKCGSTINAARGTWASLTNSIGKEADDRLKELRAMIDPFVHVHKGNILKESLPGLRDSVVVLRPTSFQKSLLEGVQGLKNPLELGHIVSLISAHPSLLLACPSEIERSVVKIDKLKRLRLSPDAGVKTKFLMELIRLSEAMEEKVLIFSQYIDPLDLIRDQLKSQFDWIEGKEVLYMDGNRDVKQRQSSINVFNEITSEARVLLASIRACSEGINLIGASRVVLLDVVWNPSVERQAISRAYRLGQKRIVYIYHLITSGTIEGGKYCRQVEKDRISGLVFSTTQNDCNGQKISDTVSDDKILEEMVQHDKLKDMFEKIIYQPKESDLIETFGLVSPVNI